MGAEERTTKHTKDTNKKNTMGWGAPSGKLDRLFSGVSLEEIGKGWGKPVFASKLLFLQRTWGVAENVGRMAVTEAV